jgi:FMN-dependent NADH-azoreductase
MMSNGGTRILHVDSAITGENSVSRQITAKIVETLRAAHPQAELVRRDVVAEPLAHLTLDQLGDKSLVEEFLGSDVIVVGAPMYNFTVPSQLKAWIDRIVVNGTTFRYTDEGKPEGLAGDRRVIVGLSRGGVYGPEQGNADYEHCESFLKTIFGFIGITPEFVRAEGVNLGPEAKEKAVSQALAEAEKLAA